MCMYVYTYGNAFILYSFNGKPITCTPYRVSVHVGKQSGQYNASSISRSRPSIFCLCVITFNHLTGWSKNKKLFSLF